jgi:ADP-heptose:LPS heptosyltransferase
MRALLDPFRHGFYALQLFSHKVARRLVGVPLLAAGLASCDLVISNDSGPLHLAAAVGTRTISLWGAGDPARTGPPPGHTVLRDRRLFCLECVKNQCPRSGPGYILPDAYMECMQLISVDDVLTSVNV